MEIMAGGVLDNVYARFDQHIKFEILLRCEGHILSEPFHKCLCQYYDSRFRYMRLVARSRNYDPQYRLDETTFEFYDYIQSIKAVERFDIKLHKRDTTNTSRDANTSHKGVEAFGIMSKIYQTFSYKGYAENLYLGNRGRLSPLALVTLENYFDARRNYIMAESMHNMYKFSDTHKFSDVQISRESVRSCRDAYEICKASVMKINMHHHT
jgi:hypothetical protein